MIRIKQERGNTWKMQIILNKQPISRFEARKIDVKKMLCYRYRICDYCDEAFDIEEKGILYWCGCKK